MTDIELKNVTYVYSAGTPFEKKALDDVGLKIQGGIITGLMGHTGCGKSTLVQLFNGILKPTSGTVCVGGMDIWEKPKQMREIRFKVGLVFQYPEYQLFEETVYKDIAFGPSNMKLPEDEINRRVREAAAFTGLDESVLDKSPFELSGGQRRRVAISGVIAMEPDVLVLDEPAAGLDPMGREEILGGIWSYQRRKKSTVIIVSHSMEDMARYSDRLIVMNNAKVYMEGTCREIFAEADKLSEAGLDVPQITRLMLKLKEKGVDVNTDVYTVEQARDTVLNFCRTRKSGEKGSDR